MCLCVCEHGYPFDRWDAAGCGGRRIKLLHDVHSVKFSAGIYYKNVKTLNY